MHQLVGQAARGREEQQAFGVDVEPADRLPLALLQARQAAEHGRPVLRIVVRDDLAGRLVVRDDPRRRRHDAQAHRLAVDLDAVAERDALAGVRRLAVDGDPAVLDRVLHVAARADARLRQHLVQLGRVGLGREDALARGLFALGFLGDLGVELAGHHLREHLGRLDRNGRLEMTRQRAFEIGRQRQRPGEAAIVALAAITAIAAAAVAPVAASAALAGGCRAALLAAAARFAAVVAVAAIVASGRRRASVAEARAPASSWPLRSPPDLSPDGCPDPSPGAVATLACAGAAPASAGAIGLRRRRGAAVAPSAGGEAPSASAAGATGNEGSAGAFMRAVPGHLRRQGDGRPGVRARHRPSASANERVACDSPSGKAAACAIGSPSAPSSVGSCSSVARPRSSRNWRVVASSAGRPGASR